MTWTDLNFTPGIDKDNSPLQAGSMGRYIDGNGIRFIDGEPETIYGQEAASTTTLLGLARGAFTWADNARNPYAAFGTHLRLYAMDIDGNVYDITPVVSRGTLTNPFTTTNGTTTTVTHTSHGLVANQKVSFSNASAVGGITISGSYVVQSVTDANNYVITTATATAAGPGGGTVYYEYSLAPGQSDGLGGAGFGTGGFGSGGYGGSASSVTLYPRTWSLAPWGENLLASPRGGGIYEWAPNVTNTELVTNGDFTSSVGWSSGSGWVISGGVATATAGAGSDLSTNVTLNNGAWHLLTFDMTRSAGTLQPKHGATSIGSALSAAGHYAVDFYANGGSDTIVFTKDSSFVGTVDNVSVKVLTTAHLLPNAPTQVGHMFVTDERIVVAVGSNLDGSFDALQIDWSDAENNQTWTPTDTNLAGGDTLSSGGRAVAGRKGSANGNGIWTDSSFWLMRYNADPNRVYDFIELGNGCGLIGPNAVSEVAGRWYWMTPAGAFFAFSGAAPAQLPCPVARDTKDNLAWVQQDKVYASRLVGKNYAEAWFFYPDLRDGSEVSRYVSLDTLSGSIWSCGLFDRTCFVDATVFQYPLAVDTTGKIWFHEKGFTKDGGPRSWFLESSYQSNTDGQILVNGIRPDSDDLQGGYTITITGIIRNIRGIFQRIYNSLDITSATGQKSIRAQGEQLKIKWSGNAAPTFWRKGRVQVDVKATSRQK